jgi:hypothetical protein
MFVVFSMAKNSRQSPFSRCCTRCRVLTRQSTLCSKRRSPLGTRFALALRAVAPPFYRSTTCFIMAEESGIVNLVC